MKLTHEEEAMVAGEYGPAAAEAIEFQIAVGRHHDAESLIELDQVSIDSSYAMHHDFGLEKLESFASLGGKFRPFVKIGKLNIDFDNWQDMGFPQAIAEKQIRLHDAYLKMGAMPYYTSLPVLMPSFGESVVWGGSNTCLLANSHIGARANLESPLSGLMSALTGRTPLFGLHLSENRRGTVLVETDVEIATPTDWDALGYATGRKVSAYSDVPVFTNLPRIKTMGERQRFDSSLVTYGTMAMYHIVGRTPEAPTLEAACHGRVPDARVKVSWRDLQSTYEEFDLSGDVDLVALGGYHLSLEQFPEIISKLKGRRVHDNVKLWLFTSVQFQKPIERLGYDRIVTAAGGRILYDTALIFMLSNGFAEASGISTVMSDSAKMCHYLEGRKIKAVLGTIDRCIETATTGRA